MSSKCAKCGVVFHPSDVVAKCVDCKLEYHPACTRAKSTQNFTKSKSKVWKCDSCKVETDSSASVRSNEEVSDDKRSILEALKLMKNELVANIDNKVGEIKTSVDLLCDALKEVNTKITTLDNQQTELAERCHTLEQDNIRLEEEVHKVRLQLLDMEQHSRSANLEIAGIPKTQGEDLFEILRQTAKVLNVPFQNTDVSIVHRLRLFSRKHSHPPLIVQFTARTTRQMWLGAARAKRSLEASEIAPIFPVTKVYVNEHLTPENKALLGKARRLRREGRIHLATYINGKILIKVKEEDVATRILTLKDLDIYDK